MAAAGVRAHYFRSVFVLLCSKIVDQCHQSLRQPAVLASATYLPFTTKVGTAVMRLSLHQLIRPLHCRLDEGAVFISQELGVGQPFSDKRACIRSAAALLGSGC